MEVILSLIFINEVFFEFVDLFCLLVELLGLEFFFILVNIDLIVGSLVLDLVFIFLVGGGFGLVLGNRLNSLFLFLLLIVGRFCLFFFLKW